MSSTLRYGVIGTGMMGVEHIHNLLALDGAEVVALCDRTPARLALLRLLFLMLSNSVTTTQCSRPGDATPWW